MLRALKNDRFGENFLAPKKLISVGFSLASDNVDYADLRQKKSLLDWDIILFRPDISWFIEYSDRRYRGKPSLGDSNSVAYQEAKQHWNLQIQEAVKQGKTVFVFLSKPTDIYIATGEKEYSGTGKNRATTTIVTGANNYDFFPIQTGWIEGEGSEMLLAPAYRSIFGSYWEKFASKSTYHVSWSQDDKCACVHTRSGKRPVSFVVQDAQSGGNLILLPDLDFDNGKYTIYDYDEDEEKWTQDGVVFSECLVQELLTIVKTAGSETTETAAPEWANDSRLELPKEAQIHQSILGLETQIDQMRSEIDSYIDELRAVTAVRSLLFESGRPLEFAIIEALKIIGFEAENYDDGVTELDVVFSCSEGRLIGEAEGKDNKPINVSKLRQIATNVIEDLDRSEDGVPAKGVLFGNAHRFKVPEERPETFTSKCITAAMATSVALIDTKQLFYVVQYYLQTGDEMVAQNARKLILNSSGLASLTDCYS